MRRAGSVAVAVVLAGGLLAPAWGGSQQDPEVRDPSCRAGDVSVASDHVVCRAWFSASTTGGATVLSTVVEVAGELEGRRLPTRVGLGWSRADGCREHWTVDDTADAGVDVELVRTCPGAARVVVGLEASRAQFSGRTLRLDVTGADLARLGSGLAPGDRLSRPSAGSGIVVRTADGPGGELVTGIDETPVGRDYAVPDA